MFQFPEFPSPHYVFMWRYPYSRMGAFPHSDICGSMLICSSPQLFAACHVLLRRLMPRHPPYALISLITFAPLGTKSVLIKTSTVSILDLTVLFQFFFGFSNCKTSIFSLFALYASSHSTFLALFFDCCLSSSMRLSMCKCPRHTAAYRRSKRQLK